MNGPIESKRSAERFTRAQKLGFYLIVAGLFEAGALLLQRVPFPQPPFTPHAGLLVLVLNRLFPTPIGWLFFMADLGSACWPLAIGVLFVLGKRPLKTYIAAEVFLSAPALCVGIDLARFGGGHVFASEQGFSLLLMFVFVSAIPIFGAIWALRENSRGPVGLVHRQQS